MSDEGCTDINYRNKPIILASVLNRFLFGNLVCVLTRQGIHTESAFIEWDKVSQITYCPQLPSRSGMRVPKDFCHAVVTVRKSGNQTYEIVIPHCPLYAIRKMKKLSDIYIENGNSMASLIGKIEF